MVVFLRVKWGNDYVCPSLGNDFLVRLDCDVRNGFSVFDATWKICTKLLCRVYDVGILLTVIFEPEEKQEGCESL